MTQNRAKRGDSTNYKDKTLLETQLPPLWAILRHLGNFFRIRQLIEYIRQKNTHSTD